MLTDAKIRKIKPTGKSERLADSNGLFLFLTSAGAKIWRYRYRHGGKEQTLVLGAYPDVSLADARAARDAARRLLSEGTNPALAKRAQEAESARADANTFEAMAREWHELQRASWTSKHAEDVIGSLEKEVFPDLGATPIREITALKVLDLLRTVEKRGAKETARRIRQRMSAVFVYGIALGLCENDPAAQIQKAMAPLKKGRQPALTRLEDVRDIIKRVDDTPASPVTKLAHRILALTVLRPGTLITTPWAEFNEIDAEELVWVVPAERMKLRLHLKDDETRSHLVPLSPQVVEAIRALKTLTGRGPLAFPNTRHAHKPMSENAIGYLINRAGFHHRHVPHGWRAAFSTIMNERHPEMRNVIDLTLAHVPKDKVESAYNRALYLDRRRELLNEWADLIMRGQKPVSELVILPRKSLKSG